MLNITYNTINTIFKYSIINIYFYVRLFIIKKEIMYIYIVFTLMGKLLNMKFYENAFCIIK